MDPARYRQQSRNGLSCRRDDLGVIVDADAALRVSECSDDLNPPQWRRKRASVRLSTERIVSFSAGRPVRYIHC